jgi:hypothetical protein
VREIKKIKARREKQARGESSEVRRGKKLERNKKRKEKNKFRNNNY